MDGGASADFLVERFAAFYEELGRIKAAIRQGRLPLYLGAEESSAAGGAQMAAMVSGRLYQLLERQAKAVRAAPATEAEVKAYDLARYVMAALADEIFILELDWAGRDAWTHWLLEHALFGTRSAGRELFMHADRLLRAGAQGPQQVDLAAVFLLALRLGFKGQHRGDPQGALRDYSTRLLQFIRARRRMPEEEPAFPQPYQHPLSAREESRMTPLTRWYVAGGVALALYLLASSVIWVLALRPFYARLG